MTNADLIAQVASNLEVMVAGGVAERSDDGYRLTDLGQAQQRAELSTVFLNGIISHVNAAHEMAEQARETLNGLDNPWVTPDLIARSLDEWEDDTPPRPDTLGQAVADAIMQPAPPSVVDPKAWPRSHGGYL